MTITLYDTHLNLMVEHGTNNPQCAVGGLLGGKESRAGKLVLGIYPVQNCHDNYEVSFAYDYYDKKKALAYFAYNGMLMLGTYTVSRSELSKRTLVNRRMYGYGVPKILHIVLSEDGNSKIYGYDITKRAKFKGLFDHKLIEVPVIVRPEKNKAKNSNTKALNVKTSHTKTSHTKTSHTKISHTKNPLNQKQQIRENCYYNRKETLFQTVENIIEGKEIHFDKNVSHGESSSFHVHL